MAISNLVLTRQIYSEETNGAHAHYREPVPLTFIWENRKFWLDTGNQMVFAIPFGKLQKTWDVIWDKATILLFLDGSAYLDIPCSGNFFHHIKFYSIMFMHNISTRVVCVNGKNPTLLHPLYPWHYRGYVIIEQERMAGKEI